jgi:hypothetical protein
MTIGMSKRWSAEKAWEWYGKRPWVMGVNYVPAVTLHTVELWQPDTFQEVMGYVKNELKLMDDIGINSLRMFLPFHIWYCARGAFFDRIDKFLCEIGNHGITMMPVIYNDCVGFGKPEDIRPAMTSGWMKYDIGHHGGQAADNAFTGEAERVGWILWDEPEWRPVLEQYIGELITRFKDDERIYAWDIWNEPGNSNRHDISVPYLKRCFGLAREAGPAQPLTAGAWMYPDGYGVNEGIDVEPIQRVALDESDIVTFHQYGKFDYVLNVVKTLKKEGRPMLNTEWLNRVLDNMMEDNLPFYHGEKIGSYSWGLVAGKSQHFLPWDSLWNDRSLPLNRWQHDLFDTYHTPYDEKELDLMRRLSPKI